MAGNIQKAGYPMVVHDVREEATRPFGERGAKAAGTPEEVARLSDVIFTSVPGPKEMEEVATGSGGILGGIKSDSVYVDLSTCGPSLIRRLEPMFRQKGAYAMDGPVLSSPELAISRTLIVMVGGEREAFDRIHPILDAFSDHVKYAGALGSGLVLKLVSNMTSMIVSQVIAEGLILGVKAGARLEDLLEVGGRAEVTGGYWGVMQGYFDQGWFRGHFDPPIFTLGLARKDIGQATQLAREMNVPMPVVNAAEQNLIEALNRGWSDKDWLLTMQLLEERAGVKVRAEGVD